MSGIVIQSVDGGKSQELPYSIACLSRVWKNDLDILNEEGDILNEEGIKKKGIKKTKNTILAYQLNISNDLLSKLVTYLEHHNGVAPPSILAPVRYQQMCKNCEDKFDAAFIDDLWSDNKQELYDLCNVAETYQIEPLIDLCCAKIASLIKGKSFTRIVQILV